MDAIESPNCPECLTPLKDLGTVERPFWWCPQCRVARLS